MQRATLYSLVLRVLVALLTRTVFQPDEYFQSLEPAYRAVFGYGHLTWEWQTAEPIRSIIYPAVNIPVYWLLRNLGVWGESSLAHWTLIFLPKALHGALAALTDVWIGELARSALGVGYSSTAIHEDGLGIKDSLMARLASISMLVVLDSIYYKKIVITPLNFLKTNLSSVSLFYGSNPWHYYASQALPILLTTALPFTLHGIWQTVTSKFIRNVPQMTMLRLIMWTLTVYSLAGHKEWRFIHPLLPLLHVFAAKSLVDLVPSTVTKKSDDKKGGRIPRPPHHNSAAHGLRQWLSLPDIPAKYIYLLLSTLPISLYIVLFYCSGPISLTSFIHSIPPNEINNNTIGILMPCHSLPGQAYIHRPDLEKGRMWSIGGQKLTDYKDQTAVFFDAPADYLTRYFPHEVNTSFPPSPFPASVAGKPSPVPVLHDGVLLYPWRHEWPLYLAFFGDLLRQTGIRDKLETKGYHEVWTAGRQWEGEDTRTGGVRVWKKYGDFVRIGPNTISINRHDTIASIYNTANCWNKTDAYHLGGLSGAGLFFIEDLEEHNKRKRYWAPAFTSEGLAKFRPMLERKTNDLVEAMQTQCKSENGVMEPSLLLQYWAHDVTGELVFGDTWEYNFCKDGDHIDLLKATELETVMFEILGQAPSLSHLMWYLPATDIFRVMDRICGQAINRRRKLGSQSADIMGHLLGEHSDEGQTLPEIHLKQEGALGILAGTNGVSSALSITLYYLASQPETYAKLKKELQDAFPFYDPLVPLDADMLIKLPYLNAVVNEGVRMGAPLGNFPRYVPKGGAVVAGEYFPENYIVSVPAWAQQVSEKNFYPHPESYIPERWLPGGLGKGSILNKNAIMTFSHGPFGCLGKTLVYQEMHLVLAKMLLAFDFKFPSNYDPDAFFEGIENRRTTRFTVPLQLSIH
ncbi:hypothetical protein CVT24_004201 [Panaeolus cyanescens]|uniref:Mannosyltransferase n=1 Tax=Panaeolus cyanescens TaxID=181874 RepID=A0A409WSZ6_9AGAR|nr:hypothetical protein CVT24_004201 [Panaeolus cyanescens]